jgi:hypothetical protein
MEKKKNVVLILTPIKNKNLITLNMSHYRSSKKVQFLPFVVRRMIESKQMRRMNHIYYPYHSQDTVVLNEQEKLSRHNHQWAKHILQSQISNHDRQIYDPLGGRTLDRFSPAYFQLLIQLWGRNAPLVRQEWYLYQQI